MIEAHHSHGAGKIQEKMEELVGSTLPKGLSLQPGAGSGFALPVVYQVLKAPGEVTAVRNDPYLRDHPVNDEINKSTEEKGTTLYPRGMASRKGRGWITSDNTWI